jgi:BMFP domain-containing protein YqiC
MRAAVEPHVNATNEAVHRLAGGRSMLEAALALQQDRIRNTADEAFAESLGRFRDNLGTVEQLLHESAQKITGHNLTELEGRAVDVRHHAVEEMHKSAEWYEKKAQTQIVVLTERAVEHAGNQLREKAGEISGVFATELDHSSRSFVQHTQTQMEEVVRDAFDRARALFAEAADTTSAAFTDEIQRHGREELEGFGTAVRETAAASFAQLQASRADIAQQTTAEQEEFLQRFRGALSGALESGIGEAREKVQTGFAPLLESWKQMAEAHEAEMVKQYTEISNHAADQYRNRLENVSNSWMVATVTTLDKQARDVMTNVATEAETKIRENCSQVFESLGDTIKERLRQLADNPIAKAKDAHA